MHWNGQTGEALTVRSIRRPKDFLFAIPRLDENPDLRIPAGATLLPGMIRPGFLDSESRRDMIELARDGSAAHRLARRANALVLLHNGMSCEAIGKVLFLDGDTIREWYKLYTPTRRKSGKSPCESLRGRLSFPS